jgi:hypothetical protein
LPGRLPRLDAQHHASVPCTPYDRRLLRSA